MLRSRLSPSNLTYRNWKFCFFFMSLMSHISYRAVGIKMIKFNRYRRLEIELERFKTAAKEQLMKEQSVNKQLRHVSLDRDRNMNS